MKKAVIGIGSNSVRMLAIEVDGSRAYRLKRDREGTRLFAGLDEHGNLSAESMNKTIAAVTRMADDARALGAEEVHLFATSASRCESTPRRIPIGSGSKVRAGARPCPRHT